MDEVKHLLIAGLIKPGASLSPRNGRWENAAAFVRADGLIEVDGKSFDTPSGAGRHVRGGATNGWYFWRLEDGRTLKDVRDSYRGAQPALKERFDWSLLISCSRHFRMDAGCPMGLWQLVIGTAAQPVGTHISSCLQCTNAHRVLRGDGALAQDFAWSDPEDERSPMDLLSADGIHVVNGKADPSKELDADELAGLDGARTA